MDVMHAGSPAHIDENSDDDEYPIDGGDEIIKGVIPSDPHSEINSLISEKSIDKLVETVGVNDKKRRKAKEIRVPRDTQVVPSTMKVSEEGTEDEQETGGRGTENDYYANMIGSRL